MYNLMPDSHHRPEPSTGGGDDENLRPSGSGHVEVEREHIFEKVVTPSDVGKLNRLVIPKQHAEKYFPLDSSSNEKELLLNFEDRNGKEWRFRYSYWNSSQSYVMTKGWSRFVKEKKLDAGDIVSFQRGGGVAKDRLFIDWRRHPDLLSQPLPHHFYSSSANHLQYHNRYGFNNSTMVNGNPCTPPGSIFYLRPVNTGAVMTSSAACVGVGVGVGVGGGVQMVYESVPVVHGKAAAKRLRLFGVNMDCPISESSNSTMRLHHYFPSTTLSPTSSSSIPNSLRNNDDDKGKGSMSLDLDI